MKNLQFHSHGQAIEMEILFYFFFKKIKKIAMESAVSLKFFYGKILKRWPQIIFNKINLSLKKYRNCLY